MTNNEIRFESAMLSPEPDNTDVLQKINIFFRTTRPRRVVVKPVKIATMYLTKHGDIVTSWHNRNYKNHPDAIAEIERCRQILQNMFLPNTKLLYFHRDDCNFKQYAEIVIPGRFSPAQLRKILGETGICEFLPDDIGLPNVAPDDSDDELHEIESDGFIPTDAKPDTDMTAGEIARLLLKTKTQEA